MQDFLIGSMNMKISFNISYKILAQLYKVGQGGDKRRKERIVKEQIVALPSLQSGNCRAQSPKLGWGTTLA